MEFFGFIKRCSVLLLMPLYFSCVEISTHTYDVQTLINHVKQSVENANRGTSKLIKDIFNIQGFSSAKVRHFLNNVCSLSHTRYLEIGTWKGSTFVSALYGNGQAVEEAVGIDNWALFGGPSEEFRANCQQFLINNVYSFYDHDCFTIDTTKLFKQPVTIYFYDGEHYAIDQEKAFTYYDSIFDDVFIALVDDWNWQMVQEGTRTAFKKLNYTILYEVALPASYAGDLNNWWNGLYVAVIQKPTVKTEL